jgi:hypothetical protein
MTGLGMSAASPADAGVVSGLFNTTQQVGGAFGVAVLSTLAAARSKDLLAAGQSATSALAGGYHLAFGTGAALIVAAALIAAVVLRQPGAGGGGVSGRRRDVHRRAGPPD